MRRLFLSVSFIILPLVYSCGSAVETEDTDSVPEAIYIDASSWDSQSDNPLVPIALSKENKEYVRRMNVFGFRLLGEVYENKGTVLSPLSTQYALGMVANGALEDSI